MKPAGDGSAAAAGFDAGANRLGALALVIDDAVQRRLAELAGSVSAATALSAMHAFLDAPSVDELAAVLGLSSSGAVRVVDRLVGDGFAVRNTSARDSRVTTLGLTAAGRRVAAKIVRARGDVLADALADLDRDERERLTELVTRILQRVLAAGATPERMCRQCHPPVCGVARRGRSCPVVCETASR